MRFGPLGATEIIIILILVLLVFGAKRLPEMARGIGQSVREFRKGIRDMKDDIERDDDEDVKQDRKKANVSTADADTAAADTTGVKTEPAEVIKDDADVKTAERKTA